MDGKACKNCFWHSDGFQNESGFCYSESDYVSPDGYCEFWEPTSRRIDLETGEAWPALREYEPTDEGEPD